MNEQGATADTWGPVLLKTLEDSAKGASELSHLGGL